MAITLKAARVNAGLTQIQAGEKIGVSNDVISNWERGLSFPNALQIQKIEEVYGTLYNDIVFIVPQNNG